MAIALLSARVLLKARIPTDQIDKFRERGIEEMIATTEERMSKLPNTEPEASAALAASVGARELRRRVWGLAGPVIGENFLETLLGIIDTLLVAGLGAVALAGVGSALQVMFFMISAL